MEAEFDSSFASLDEATIATVKVQNLLTGRNCRCLDSLGQINQQRMRPVLRYLSQYIRTLPQRGPMRFADRHFCP